MGQRYTIVACGEGGPLDAEVSIRAYTDVRCPHCGAEVGRGAFSARLRAAYVDGLALGQMLRRGSVDEYIRGLRAGLDGA